MSLDLIQLKKNTVNKKEQPILFRNRFLKELISLLQNRNS